MTATVPPRSARDDGGYYSTVAIAFHWTIALLVIVNLAIGLFHDSVTVPLIPAHKAIGITILALTLGRIAWRLGHPAPVLPADVPGWQRMAATVTHMALYALMLLMPLTGWWLSSAGPKRYPLDWFGLFPIPYLPVSAGGDAAHGAHILLGWTMIALVALHVAAALKHHFVDRDAVLIRMAPVLGRYRVGDRV